MSFLPPLYNEINKVLKEVKKSPIKGRAIISPTGSGKTVSLIGNNVQGVKLAVIVPRIAIVDNLYEYCTKLFPNKRIGRWYSTQKQIPDNLDILIMTTGIFNLSWEYISKIVNIYVIDEFHELTIDQINALHIIRNKLDKKFILMSAMVSETLLKETVPDIVINKFDVPSPFKVTKLPVYNKHQSYTDNILQLLKDKLPTTTGNVLVIVPTKKMCRYIKKKGLGDTHEYVLLYRGSENIQSLGKEIFGRPIVYVATPIVESSLTLQDIRIIIDSCLCVDVNFDTYFHAYTLATRTITKAQQLQRLGRGGRVCDTEYIPLKEVNIEFPAPKTVTENIYSLYFQSIVNQHTPNYIGFPHHMIPTMNKMLVAMGLITVVTHLREGKCRMTVIRLTELGNRIKHFAVQYSLPERILLYNAACTYGIDKTGQTNLPYVLKFILSCQGFYASQLEDVIESAESEKVTTSGFYESVISNIGNYETNRVCLHSYKKHLEQMETYAKKYFRDIPLTQHNELISLLITGFKFNLPLDLDCACVNDEILRATYKCIFKKGYCNIGLITESVDLCGNRYLNY